MNSQVSEDDFDDYLNIRYRFVRTDIKPDKACLKKYSACPKSWKN
jgi:hypothetical protein